MRKKKIKLNAPRSFNYRTDYRDRTVAKSVKNYNELVIQTLTSIYANPNATVYDFPNALISKLLSDDLIEAVNGCLWDLGRHSKPETILRLTKSGCKRIGKPFKASA